MAKQKKTGSGKRFNKTKQPAQKTLEKPKKKALLAPAAPQENLLRDEELEQRILAFLQETEQPQKPETVASALRLSATVVEKLLQSLYQVGEVARSRKHAYALPQHLGFLVGTLQGSTEGRYTLLTEDTHIRLQVVNGKNHGALHGDLVWAREEGQRVVVERIIRRANQTIVGTLRLSGRKAFLTPDNRRLPARVPLTGSLLDAGEGDLVVARVLTFEDHGELKACVQQRLGEADQVRTLLRAIIYQSGLSIDFPRPVLQQAEAAAAEDIQSQMEQRLDLRGQMIFTIDGADAKDFDDAVSIEKRPDSGVCLGVHIADVSHYVRPGSLLDEEALDRGTSVYLPGMVLPMLPEALSNGSCSLRPDEDRLTLSVLMEIDGAGEVRSYQIHKSVIRSKARLVYEDVNALLAGDEEQEARYGHLLGDLSMMAALAAKIRARRYARGSLDFDVEEAAITVDAKGEPVDIAQRARGISNRMIEDFMILANETVARHAQEKDLPFLYRVHEDPDAEKLASFQLFLSNVGLRVKQGNDKVTPKMLQQLLEEAEGRPDYPVIAQLMIRAMAKAKYDPRPLGHFGLAAKDYCHFTSPIRRYPDLWIHRVISMELAGKLDKRRKALKDQAENVAVISSTRERSAMEAERAADRLMMARYMLHHIGETYDGVIVGVVEWGLYVQLPNTVEGLVHVRTLPDHYNLDAQKITLVGTRTGNTFRIGQGVHVRLVHVDVTARQIDFELSDEE